MCRRLLVAVLVMLAAALVAPATPAPAAERRDGLADISAALDDVEVDSPEYRRVAAGYEQARATREQAQARLQVLDAEERSLAVERARAGALARLARAERDRWQRRMATLAVRAYMGAGAVDAAQAAGLDPTYTAVERRELLVAEVDESWEGRFVEARRALRRITEERDRLEEEHRGVVEEQRRTEAVRAEAAADERRLRPSVQDARATAVVVGSDLTLVALDAYLRAALDMGTAMPGCGLPWWLLAGIGRVESGHGTFATSTLDPGGTARPGIYGIALDGSAGTAVITDTDGGRLDNDRRSDRAVGPMQFIPSTWARYASDGDHDGTADPQNLYDAAHAAARYLCTASGDLTTSAGQHRAIFAYNHSEAYVAKVQGFAQEYVGLLA